MPGGARRISPHHLDALAVAEHTGSHYWDAELQRLRGALTLRSGRSTSDSASGGAEACFREAIAIARRQQAKSLELRAVTSLSRLWHSQRK
jgi:predicted ATPase